MKRKSLRIAAIMMSLIMALTMGFVMPETVSAAAKAKTPAKPKITSVQVKKNVVTIKWRKAKNAKQYRVYVQTGKSKWKYWKKVKKSKKNKKKYSNNLKYKLVKSGKKYKVYRQVNKYKVVCKKTKKRYFKFKGKAGKTYHFAVRAFNGKKYSKASAIRTAKTPKAKKPASTVDPENPSNTEDPNDPSNSEEQTPDETTPSVPATYTITYNLDGGTNNPSNPSTYTEGDAFRLGNPKKEGYDFWGWYSDASFSRKVSEIISTTKGNLTLYAKWGIKAINTNGEGMEDMIWTWWHYPQVVVSGDKTFWGYATSEGYCGVAMYDAKTGKTVKTNLKQAKTVDDHNGISLTLLKDNRIMCTYAGGHNSDSELHVRISDNPLDVSSFKTDIMLDSVGKTCYGQIMESSGKYWLFYRVNNNSWAGRSSEDGRTWSKETVLVKANMQYYCKFMPTTEDGLIRILMYSNPAEPAPEIRMGFLDTNFGTLLNVDKTAVGNSGVDYKSFDVIQDVEKGKTQRLLDVAVTAPDNPRFLIASFTGVKGANDSVYYLCDSGKKFKVCDGGKPLWDPKYQLGASFVGSNGIVAARHSNLVDYVEMYSFNGKVVSLKNGIFKNQITGSVRSGRPIADPEGKAVLWHYGYYNIDKYTDFNTSAILYLPDKNMIIGAPEQQAPTSTEYKITYVLNGGTNHEANPKTYVSGTSFELKAPVRDGFKFLGWYADEKFTTNVSAITEDISGDLTLYAKWASKAAYTADADTRDMIWSWWIHPHAVNDGSKTFWTYTTKESTVGVAMYDEDTGKVSRTVLQNTYQNNSNDVFAPAVMLTDNKRLLVAVPREEAAQKCIHVYISDSRLDISTFSTDIKVPTSRAATLCQLVKAGGLYYLFYRGENGFWIYKTSEDGEAWSSETFVVMAKKTANTQYQYYCKFMPTTDGKLIRILMQANPGEDISSEIRMGFLNTEDGTIYDSDAVTALGTEKIDYSSFGVILPAASGKSLRLLDAAVTAPASPRFIYADFTNESGVNDSVYYLYDAEKRYTICSGGKALLTPKAQLGASFAGSGRIVAARSNDGRDIVELYKYSSSGVSLEKQIYSVDISDGTRAARPVADANGKVLLWHKGIYTDAKKFDTGAVLYVTSSGKLIEPPVVYTIKYVLNGGKNNVDNPSSYAAGKAVSLKDPTRDDYDFKGWFTDKGLSQAFTGITAQTTGNITVYAKWEEKALPPTVHTITYELNGGTNNSENPKKYTEGDAFTLKDPVRADYDFMGWFRDAGFSTPFNGVTADMTSDITVYAKWKKKDIPLTVIKDADMDNMIWSWWTSPQVISEGSKTFWTFATNDGNRGVACFDSSTGEVEKTLLTGANANADTNFMALMLTSDKRVMCVCARDPGAKKIIHIHISDAPLDIGTFTEIALPTKQTTAPKYDYTVQNTQLLRSGGNYYMFHRLNDKGSWAYWMSADGETWTDPKVLVLQSEYVNFCRFVSTTDDNIIRVVMQSEVDGSHPEIRMGFIDTSDGTVYGADGATPIGTLEKGRIANTNFSVLQEAEPGMTLRLLDVAVTAPSVTRFISASFTYMADVNDGVYYLYDSGTVTKICDEGKHLQDPKYQLGASFAGADTIIAARNVNGKDCIETYTIGSSGATLKEQIYEQDTSGGIRAARPVSNATGSAVLWHVGTYSSATTYNTSAVLYLKGSNTIVKGTN